jgi:hypothetical protein
MATETLVSPGVLLQEVDKSYITPGTDPSGLAVIGPAVKGPIEVPTLINNFQQYKDTFGTTFESASQGYEYFTSLAARNYFKNGGNSLLVVRAVSASATWDYSDNTHISASAKGGTQPFTLETIGKGEILNNAVSLTADPLAFSGNILKSGSADNFRWEIANVNNAAGTFTLVIRRGDDSSSKPIILEQFPNVSLDPLSPNYIAKAVGDQKVTKNSTADGITVTGEYPNKSRFIRVSNVNLPTYEYAINNQVGTDGASTSYSASLPTAQSGAFYNGVGSNIPVNGAGKYGEYAGAGADSATNNNQGLREADFTDALNILTNKEEFKFKTLIIPGFTQEYNNSNIVSTAISNTETRGDSLYLVDPVKYGTTTLSTVTTETEELDTSFAAAYWPWAQVPSVELGRNVWCPASVVVPGAFALNDSIAAPWFAPAGNTRGRLSSVAKVETKLSKSQRDTLYTSKVNPLATFPGKGVVIFGQKTLQQAASALDRVNVRRLLLDVKDTIDGFSRKLVFEQNTEETRQRFLRQVNPYLENLVQRQGLYAFQVKMDGQLNTADIIDQNQLIGQVFLQPTKTAEFIALDFVITPTGASFED